MLELIDGGDYLFLVDPAARYLTLDGPRYDLAAALELEPDEVEVEEVQGMQPYEKKMKNR